MTNLTYQEVGLPVSPGGDWVYSGLQYSHAGRTLIVTLRRSATASAARVYMRRTDEQVYREALPGVAPRELWSVVTSFDSPLAFFAIRENRHEGLTIHQVTLPLSTLEPLPPATLDGSHPRFWLSKLHAVADDGKSVLVSVAVPQRPRPDGGYSVHYALARMDVGTGKLDVVAELPSVFA